MIEIVLFSITIIATLTAIYSGIGGRSLFGTHEKPDRIIGKYVQFKNIDYLGPMPPAVPSGIVEKFIKPMYRIKFDSPFSYEEKTEHYVDVVPHSKGWPVSGAAKTSTAVIATFESGRNFWTDIKVIDKRTN